MRLQKTRKSEYLKYSLFTPYGTLIIFSCEKQITITTVGEKMQQSQRAVDMIQHSRNSSTFGEIKKFLKNFKTNTV